MASAIAIVGMACRYPDARTPRDLWENVLSQRRAFRRLPDQRLRAEDYVSADRDAPDRTYVARGAVLEGYAFDRHRFRVAGGTYRQADLAHWLALEVAADALVDAGYAEGEGLPRDATGVLLGNTLTGEFSRANLMRLRWPYVRRVVDAMLAERQWTSSQRLELLDEMEARYKAPFEPIGAESLAGGLSNTIAGRICNHFDLHGGGYTLDGACASSLLALANACSALTAGDLDVALAGGVDLSLDPFEIIGFAKTGALAPEQMRVYDVRSAGFFPGEGCGMAVLMRHADALAEGRRVYAVIRGWGISSDGAGGITRPETDGQLLAVRRAYRRAGVGPDAVAYFEGHGTGTAVGDETELRTLAQAIRGASAGGRRAGSIATLGTVKANIGHTKAAAGIAGLIKATMAVHEQTVPPTTGCTDPQAELAGADPVLRIAACAEPWPEDRSLLAAVSAMGFGGINTHIALEGTATAPQPGLAARTVALSASAQDAEVFLLAAADRARIASQVEHLARMAAGLSVSELTDLAARLADDLVDGPVRAALVAAAPADLSIALDRLRDWIDTGVTWRADVRIGAFLGDRSDGTPRRRIGLLFPGHAAPTRLDGGAMARRFDAVAALYDAVALPDGDPLATEVAQPAIAAASRAGLSVLEALGIEATVAVGHSVGELAALHWAGAFDEAALLRIAGARGQLMASDSRPGGAMAGIGAEDRVVQDLLEGDRVVIAGLNAPGQTIVSGDAEAVQGVVDRAKGAGLRATMLPVAQAFHSPHMADVGAGLRRVLERERPAARRGAVVSTVTGRPLGPRDDVGELLVRQLTAPVRFIEALAAADQEVDLWLECGPGHVMSGIVADQTDKPVVPLDACGPELRGVLNAAAAAHAAGASVCHDVLFAGRFARPFDLDRQPSFLASPCESAPLPSADALHAYTEHAAARRRDEAAEADAALPPAEGSGAAASVALPLDIVRAVFAAHLELPVETVQSGSRLLGDLHLNSIAIGQLVGQAARRLNLAPPASPTEYAAATVGELADALDAMQRTGGDGAGAAEPRLPAGVGTWVRGFVVEWEATEPVTVGTPAHDAEASADGWMVVAAPGDGLADTLRAALNEHAADGGVLVCLPDEDDDHAVELLLAGGHETLRHRRHRPFVVVQPNVPRPADTAASAGHPILPGPVPGAAFAKTLHLEAGRGATTCVIDLPAGHADAARRVVDEVRAARGFRHVRYDSDGQRREPALRLLPPADQALDTPLGPDDVLLVTGGGKGIAAECVLALARRTGARIALLGRSDPHEDQELATNLQRMRDADVQLRYCRADVSDADAVRRVLHDARTALGPITAVLHGAGMNEPRLIEDLDEAAFARTLAPKVRGVLNVLGAIDTAKLRLFVTFSSIIGRMGLVGEADYALANEWLSQVTERVAAARPGCRCLAVESSIWSGVGMGQRLGRVDALIKEGITPITPDQGVAALCDLLRRPLPATSVVLAGRFGDPPTLRLHGRRVPMLRFVEEPKVHYPGVELVVDVELSVDRDPYVVDHQLHRQPLFPAVMGLEAMAQVAMAVRGTDQRPDFEQVVFNRPVVVPHEGGRTIRLAALVHETGCVEVALRSAETDFQADHFRVMCRFGDAPVAAAASARRAHGDEAERPYLPLDPVGDLYEGGLLFHDGRFRRLQGYRCLRATECCADIRPDGDGTWFAHYMADRLVLGDPGARDTAIHAIQACIPHARLLPIGADRVRTGQLNPEAPSSLHARERSRDGDLFIYDVTLRDAEGAVVEEWEGLRLKKVESIVTDRPWAPALLGPYVERRLQELVPGSGTRAALSRRSGLERSAASAAAVADAVGCEHPAPLTHRPDGKPLVAGGPEVSIAHGAHWTLAVAGDGPLGCDLEPVAARSDDAWSDLLGPDRLALARLLAGQTGADAHAAATCVWAATECLKKAGLPADAPLVFASADDDGWSLLYSGDVVVCTCLTSLRGGDAPLALSVLAPRAARREEILQS